MPGMRATGNGQHSVGFFSGTEPLVERVSSFLTTGLSANDAAILVATAEHRELVERAMTERGIDVTQVGSRGQYISLDAEETLSKLVVGGIPDRKLFSETIGSVVSQAQSKYMRVLIYGEMVSLLWLQGRSYAAIALEDLWNEVIGDRLSLLCGYSVGALGHSANELESIVAVHTDVVEPEDLHAG